MRVTSAKPPTPRTAKVGVGRRLTQIGATLVAGALAFEMAIPAFAGESEVATSGDQPVTLSVQSLAVDPTLVAFSDRDTWGVTSWAQMLKLRYGTRDFSYTTTGTGPLRWPFPYPVPISSGFGDRAAPCRGCSSVHLGVDFTPGYGTPVAAIADGVVVAHVEGGGLGNHVMIQHEIDGQTVYSEYGHMQFGSSPLQVGDQVLVGDFVGLVGSTGASTGPHLHLNIMLDTIGNNVDPFAWLKRNAS